MTTKKKREMKTGGQAKRRGVVAKETSLSNGARRLKILSTTKISPV
jgi:hypothetical protein